MTRTLSAIMLGALCFIMAGCNSTANTGAAPSDVLSLQSGPDAAMAAEGLQLVENLPPPAGTGEGAEQLLAANDVLEIHVYNAVSLNRVVQIDSSGLISLPLIGVQTAAGKSVRQLERDLKRVYGASYLQWPDITVSVKELVSQKVTVDGEVARAGLYPVVASTTLLDAIAMAGGLRDIADQTKVYVFRDVGEARLVANYNVEEIRSGRRDNPRIFGGDVIMVFTSQGRMAVNSLKEALGIAVNASRLAAIP